MVLNNKLYKVLGNIGFIIFDNVVAKDWETETLDIDMGRISNDDDLGLDLAGGR